MFTDTATNGFHCRSRILIAFAIRGYLRNAEVNSKNAAHGVNRRRGGQVYC